ncbi:hypothetical protein [Secundilactobacillus collinoides]|uniref:Uncharacterized protein n=1 Tax=Secundilactobacillus collinoides DSM 20515 = JCM 1123 TaxID=1423733 RepID=A0A0R2BA27_SECCO|nr:hypothetical protein [Secundilactobacillus collinoides]KRM76351.1 hypothetical protein FC82_GL001711 [Secundilactobacillus collinoides DSM 20515 = JCM 1123]
MYHFADDSRKSAFCFASAYTIVMMAQWGNQYQQYHGLNVFGHDVVTYLNNHSK